MKFLISRDGKHLECPIWFPTLYVVDFGAMFARCKTSELEDQMGSNDIKIIGEFQ